MCLVISRCWPADHRNVLDHALHPDGALVDRVDLATPLSLSSRLVSRLTAPRSGLERSDFVLWPVCDFRFAAAAEARPDNRRAAGLAAMRIAFRGPAGRVSARSRVSGLSAKARCADRARSISPYQDW
jgi:hypothetical protein